MKRLALTSVVGLAVLAHGAGATSAPALSAVRICSGAYQDENGECRVDQRRRLLLHPEVRCSVHVDAPRRTRLTARLLYQGQLERSYSLVLSGRRTRAIAVAFEGLGLGDYGVPGGRYTCEFTLGAAHASVTGTSRGPTARVRGAAACAVYGAGSRICAVEQPIFLAARSISCSVVIVGMRGHRATTQLQRREGSGWRTLYEARDLLRVPIGEVWAYHSAPAGSVFASGSYRCRFLVDGRQLAEKLFDVRG
jgi:hypothetical protein